jgi:transcriptional regulator with XRE-family HTH domain
MTNTQPKSWRDVLPIHPAAELFPLMSESELRELGEDIKAHGLVSSIVLHEGKLLDGRNRLDAMELVGILPGDIDGTIVSNLDSDPYNYVVAANIHRRHLTDEQRRELIAKIIKAKPEASDRAIGKQVKRDHKTVAKVRRKLESTGESSPVEKRVGADGKSRSKPRKTAKGACLRQRAWELFEEGKSQTDIANELGVAQSTVSKYLRGESKPPRPEKPAASAEVSTEQRKAEIAALTGAADPRASHRGHGRDHGPLNSNNNFEDDAFEPNDNVEDPRIVLLNVLDTIKQSKAVAEAYRKILKVSPFDRGAKIQISDAIDLLIVKWRSVQSTLTNGAGRP